MSAKIGRVVQKKSLNIRSVADNPKVEQLPCARGNTRRRGKSFGGVVNPNDSFPFFKKKISYLRLFKPNQCTKFQHHMEIAFSIILQWILTACEAFELGLHTQSSSPDLRGKKSKEFRWSYKKSIQLTTRVLLYRIGL